MGKICIVELTIYQFGFTFYTMDNQIRVFRAKHGMTQNDLARETMLSRQTIQHIESGSVVPNLKHAAAIAAALHTTVDELFVLGSSEGGEAE